MLANLMNEGTPSANGHHKRRTMLGWLALEAKDRREAANVAVTDLAHRAGVNPTTIYLFEAARRWPRKRTMDEIIAVYADMTGLADGREIWETALSEWLKVPGARPLLPGEKPDPLEIPEREAEQFALETSGSPEHTEEDSAVRVQKRRRQKPAQ